MNGQCTQRWSVSFEQHELVLRYLFSLVVLFGNGLMGKSVPVPASGARAVAARAQKPELALCFQGNKSVTPLRTQNKFDMRRQPYGVIR